MPNDRDASLPRTQTAADQLPPPDTKRWTARRKARSWRRWSAERSAKGEVCRRYDLSVREFLSSQNAVQRHGVQGLHISKLQK